MATPPQLPASEHVTACIRFWQGLDLRRATDAEIEDSLLALRDRVGSFIVQRRTGSYPELWRVRRSATRFSRVGDFWYPPADIVGQGRCNTPGQSLLYCSPKAITALDEMEGRRNDVVHLIKYRVHHSLPLDRVVGFTDPSQKDGEGILQGASLASYLLLRDFIQGEFVRPVGPGQEHLYRISAALCRVWTNADTTGGWLYPSTKSAKSENVALKPSYADSCLEVKAAYLVQITDEKCTQGRLRYNGISLQVEDVAEVTASRVTWSNKRGTMNFFRPAGNERRTLASGSVDRRSEGARNPLSQ